MESGLKADDGTPSQPVPSKTVSPSMCRFILALAALSACAPTTTHELRSVESGPTDYVENLPPNFSAQQVKADLEAAIVERFGVAALKRAQSAEAFVLSRHYQGLPQP